MDFLPVVFVLVLVLGLWGLVRRARRDEFTSGQRRDFANLTRPWEREPPIGHRFIFCGLRMVVVDVKFHGGLGWQQGVQAAYVCRRGRVRYVTIPRQTWEGLADGYLLDEFKNAPFKP